MKKTLTDGDFLPNFRKIIRVMRVSLFLIFVSTAIAFSAVSYSQSAKLTLYLENVTVKDVIAAIEEQSEFIFFYQDQQIDISRKVTLRANDDNIDSVLKELFKGTHNIYTIRDRQIIVGIVKVPLRLEPIPIEIITEELNVISEQPRTKEISGIVTDDRGQALIGVSIVVKGTTTGTITDIRGNFRLEVPLDAETLVFSYVGMKTQEVDIMDKLSLNIIMFEELVGMEEVVVVGYGTQKKESVVGAISQASGDVIRQNVQGGDLRSGLAGSIPGLITLRTTGIPGGADFGPARGNFDTYDQPIAMYIRGMKTWNDAGPLVLIDGVERDLHHVNPYEIDKISILKDASATAVFGVKGANGVILITTQRGKEGKANLTFDYSATAKTLSRIAEKAGAYEANLAKNYAILNEVSINESSWTSVKPEKWVDYFKTEEYPEYFPDINWVDETMQRYVIDQNINMTLNGGNKYVKYHSSVAFIKEKDLLNRKDVGQGYNPNSNFQRINLRSNLDFRITPTTSLSTNLSGNYFKQLRGGDNLWAWRGIWGMAPDLWPVKYRDGIYAVNPDNYFATNPIWYLNYSGYSVYKGMQVNTDFVLNQKLDFLTKGLNAKARLSYDNTVRNQGPNVSAARPTSKYINPKIVDDPRFRPGMTDSELALLEAEYTTWNVEGAGTDGYDWTLPENTYSTESINLDVYRSLLYEFSLNYSRDFGKNAVSGLILMNRQINATGSEFMS